MYETPENFGASSAGHKWWTEISIENVSAEYMELAYEIGAALAVRRKLFDGSMLLAVMERWKPGLKPNPEKPWERNYHTSVARTVLMCFGKPICLTPPFRKGTHNPVYLYLSRYYDQGLEINAEIVEIMEQIDLLRPEAGDDLV